MKKIFLGIALLCIYTVSSAQQISKITLASNGTLEAMALTIDDNVIVNLSDDGAISKWGLEPYNLRTENYGDFTDRLDPYQGRVEYYTASDNEAFRGKVKYIGKTQITYYASYDEEYLRGKIRSIGASVLTYYQAFDDQAFKGKLKSIGPYALAYYSSFDNQAFRGKLRTVGISNFTYYSSFDDKAFAGKIKSIGNASFSYYSSFDKVELRGVRKGGQPMQFINGVKYYIK